MFHLYSKPMLLDRFVMLKDKPAQGATDSKRYWIYSAKVVLDQNAMVMMLCLQS